MTRLISMVTSRMRPQTEFKPIDDLNNLDGIALFFRIIARNVYAFENWPGRSDCTRIAVDILNIMSLSYKLAEAIVTTDVYSFPDANIFPLSSGNRRAVRNRRSDNIFHLWLNDDDDESSDELDSEDDSSTETDESSSEDNEEGGEEGNGAEQAPILQNGVGESNPNSNLNPLGNDSAPSGAENTASGRARRDGEDKINGLSWVDTF